MEIRKFVLAKFKKYSQSMVEEDTLRTILKEFTGFGSVVTLYDQYPIVGKYISVVNNKENPYLLIHVDRVPLSRKPKTIVTKNTITGQLDNLISVAVAKYLFDNNYNYNYLFTTREEISVSYRQVRQYFEDIKASSPILIDLDIDIVDDLGDIPNGEIFLRDGDPTVKYNKFLVKQLRLFANKYEIPYLEMPNHWSEGQMGLITRFTRYGGTDIGMPLVNYHSGNETIGWRCIENTVKLLTVMSWEKQDGSVSKEKT